MIGVDAYWAQEACLKSAVRDADRFADWLLRSKRIESAAQISKLLAPDPPSPKNAKVATRRAAIDAIEALQEVEPGDWLFVYFSGHGITTRRGFSDEAAIALSDFDPLDTQQSIGLRSLLERLLALPFRDQLIIVDACRDIPFDGEFDIGAMPRPRVPSARRAAPQQFVLHATSPRRKALAVNEEGVFTGEFLKGLEGERDAKVWDDEREEYIVRFEALFEYVKKAVATRSLAADEESRRAQVPRRSGESGAVDRDSNPILAVVASNAVANETLSVQIRPPKAADDALITVWRGPERVYAQHARGRTALSVAPKGYHVKVEAEGFQGAPVFVDVYGPKDVTVTLRPQPIPSQPPILLPSADALSPGSLSVTNDIGDATVEVRNSAGLLVGLSHQAFVLDGLRPGPYAVRVQTPRLISEQRLFVEPGLERELVVEPRMLKALRASRAIHHDGAQAAKVDAGVEVVVDGRELLEPQRAALAGMDIRASWVGTSLVREFKYPFAVATVAAPSTFGWLRVALPGTDLPEVVFPVAGGEGYRHYIAIDLLPDAPPRLFVYSGQIGALDEQMQVWSERAEAVQSHLAAGRFAHALALSRVAAMRAGADPFGALLFAYASLRIGADPALVSAVLDQLPVDCSDVHVLRAVLLERSGDMYRAEVEFQAALEVGVPLFGHGLPLLAEAIDTYALTHPRARVVQSFAASRPTAFMPTFWIPPTGAPNTWPEAGR